MSGSLNKVMLIGHLGRDPETRYSADGAAITNAQLATSESYKDKGGNKQEKTEWHRLVFFGKLAEIAGEYLVKGSHVYVEGRIQTRSWDKDGEKKYSTEIVCERMQMLGARSGGGDPPAEQQRAPAGQAPAKKSGGSFDDMDDDIPFMQPFHAGLWRMV